MEVKPNDFQTPRAQAMAELKKLNGARPFHERMWQTMELIDRVYLLRKAGIPSELCRDYAARRWVTVPDETREAFGVQVRELRAKVSA